VLLDEAQVEAVCFLIGLARAQLLQGRGQAEDRLRIVRHQVQGTAKVGHRLVDAFEADQQAAQVAARVAIVGIGFDRLLEGLSACSGLRMR
jgi:hypothetical protein